MAIRKVKNTRYIICTKKSQVLELIRCCLITRYASLDFETKAEGPYGVSLDDDEDKKLPCGPQYKEDAPTVIGISYQPGITYVIPLDHHESPFKGHTKGILRLLSRQIFENRSVIKVGYNLKFELRWLIRYGCTFKGIVLDVMLAKYLLDEERPNDLKSLVSNKIPEYSGYEDEVRNLRKQYRTWALIPLEKLSPYNAIDCDLTLRLLFQLEPKLIAGGFYNLFRNMCNMQTRVLAESEAMGMNVDRKYLRNLCETTKNEIDKYLHILLAHHKIKGFQRWRLKEKAKKLIKEVQAEIKEILVDENKNDAQKQRLINARNQKVSRYIAGELITKKEKVDDFNMNSPNQLVDFIYLSPAGLDMPIVKYTKNKETKQDTDRPSTDEEALEQLIFKDKSGFIKQLMAYRTITKLYSTYMVGMEYRMTPNDRIHGSFLIHGTVTGRLSSKNPNLQNIPRDTTSSQIKRMFICPPGHVLLECDYGQAELRVVAELSGDKAMLDIFNKGYNVHVATACKMNKCFDEYDKVKAILKDPKHPEFTHWEKEKKKGKTLNFSILYMQSDKETAKQMTFEFGYEVTMDEAAAFKLDWFDEFPGIKKWIKNQAVMVKRDGYVKNMFGRKRRLPDINSTMTGKINKAIRDAVNAPVQGASSDFTQLATIELRRDILRGDLIMTDYVEYLPQAYTVHDSIGFYIQPKYIHEAVPKVLELMHRGMTQKYFGFEMEKCMMKASPEIGMHWGDLKEYDPKKDYEAWYKEELPKLK